MSREQATVLFVEDEIGLLEEFSKELRLAGHRVLGASRPDEVLEILDREARIDLAILDFQLPMDGCRRISLTAAAGGREAGYVLALELRKRFRRAPIVYWTSKYVKELRAKALRLGNCRWVPKSSGPEPVLDFVADALEGFSGGRRPKTFIVHGHDELTMRELRSWLRTTLRFPEPVVLRHEISGGGTVIEKLESFAQSVDLVFVLLTPDDRALTADGATVGRARQNVIFELGYFLGLLGRGTGRVVLLHVGPIELPSDLGGVISIDVTDGIEKASTEILKEIGEWA